MNTLFTVADNSRSSPIAKQGGLWQSPPATRLRIASFMFRIRRIHDDLLPRNRAAIAQCGEILKKQIATATEIEVERLTHCLHDPMGHRFRAVLLVAENRSKLTGFALMLHDPSLGFSWLDYLCAAPNKTSGGIGGALYQRCREEAFTLKSQGLFCECWTDDAALMRPEDKPALAQNKARLRFYENFGARPVASTIWDTPAPQQPVTHVVYDDLGRDKPPSRLLVREVFRAVLERRYSATISPADVEVVLKSVKQDPVALRELRYHKPTEIQPPPVEPNRAPIAAIVTDDHSRHWVHDRGYHESPVRIRAILEKLRPSGLVTELAPKSFPDEHISAVHQADYCAYLKEIAAVVGERSIYPDVFPLRNQGRPPKDPIMRAGWFCIDTFTPLNANAIAAARRAVDCALTGAELVAEGESHLAYVLARPPGHHAESKVFGGYCYYCNAGIAANWLAKSLGKIAILDIDFHHGNGQQDIFYQRSDVFTISIHGDPATAYPYYTGFADERGQGSGFGANLNIPLPDGINGDTYFNDGLTPALAAIRAWEPAVLVVALGVDTGKADPTGTWSLSVKDFERNGKAIGELGLPTLVIQEGGYRTKSIGNNVVGFLKGLGQGAGVA